MSIKREGLSTSRKTQSEIRLIPLYEGANKYKELNRRRPNQPFV
ncbi:hypothetical protein SAMN05421760_101437 [Neptunomonas antarctica]|uniref:Uncharacterized protein n=1 Tax=Neptunomonas antarctica TaxID=619304 RepID=A0A1N7J0W4_9GAMM|nr:hypothetical protein SAMN05421760_101437 [Neptunomonas antarctica]